MKKTILFASAALAALSFTSCSNEVDMFDSLNEERATINLNITNDDEILTRATNTITGDGLSAWLIKVGDNAWIAANTVQEKSYPTGSYTIKVGQYQSLAAAMPNNDPGHPYYAAEKSVNLQTGANSVTFECGTAQNAKLTVNWSGAASNSDISVTSVGVKQYNDPEITTPDEEKLLRTYSYTSGGSAYFYAGQKAFCTINYSYKSTPKTAIVKVLSALAAAKEYKFNINANTNGTITTLTITYDDTFDSTGDPTVVTIDAATGNEYTGN